MSAGMVILELESSRKRMTNLPIHDVLQPTSHRIRLQDNVIVSITEVIISIWSLERSESCARYTTVTSVFVWKGYLTAHAKLGAVQSQGVASYQSARGALVSNNTAGRQILFL